MAFNDTLEKMRTSGSADPRYGGYDIGVAQRAMDQAQFGPGSGTSYDPWEQPNEGTIGYTKGANGQLVRMGGGPAASAGGSYASNAGFGGLPTGGASTSGYSPSFGGVGSYSLPDATAAAQKLRELQMAGAGGLTSLVNRDTAASRKKIEDALYAGQEESINTAADRARQAMIEGTFARGVGSSSILTELAGRGEQEHADALARAKREAFTQAGSEDRADLASLVNTFGTGFNAATAGLQGEANVALTNLAREQQASQFAQNLGFQGSENALNRAQNASQFGSNLGLQYAQLGQQASQFGQNLEFQGGQNALNRDFTAGENAAGRQFTGAENAANRGLTTSENALNRTAQAAGQQSSQDFAGTQNEATRALQRYLAETGQTYTASQNQLTREQQMQMLLLQLANSRDIASGHDLAAGIGAAGRLIPSLADIIAAIGGA